jgi:nitroimidazol reductase NimA-like FMN-containing flavoprotein (pyridoxamine 5'-phosphate oxidase superfamily)
MRLKKSIAAWFDRERICRVATANSQGMPHLVPVCQVVVDGKIYFASASDGRKALNLAENPRLAVTVDLYSDDWSHIKGATVQGRTRLYDKGPRFRKIRALLYRKYPQYSREAALDESDSVVVEVTPVRVFTWGLD